MAAKKFQPPKASVGDVAHASTKAILSALPYIGGPAAELFQLVLQPPLEKRRAEWMERIAEGLETLEKDGLKVQDLKDNPQFISAVMQAYQIALHTHQEDKLRALRNAVLNVASGNAPEDALQGLFLSYVDFFTAWHIRILKVFQAPPGPAGMSLGGLSNVLESAIPEMRGQRDLYDSLWRDLYIRGLTNTENLHMTMSGSGLVEKRTTGLGDKFLAFISEPK